MGSGAFWVLFGAAIIVGLNIGGRSYGTDDVERYAQMVLEMRHHGSLVPTTDGIPYHEAAPLAAWLPYVTTWVFGELSPFTMRLHSALAAIATIVVTLVLARRASPRIALVAGAAASLNYLACAYGRSSRIEAVLGLAVTTAVAAFFLAGRQSGPRRYLGFGAAGLATALGVAAKGPYALAIVAATLGPFLLFERRWRDILEGGAIVAVLTVGLTAAWLVPYVRYLGPDQARALYGQLFLLETLEKFQHGYGKFRPFHHYLVASPPKLLPWSLFAIVAMVRILRRPRSASSLERLCTSWVIFPVVLLSLAAGKHIRYLVPLMPAVAILAAHEIDRWLGSPQSAVGRAFALTARALGGGLVVAGLVAAVGFSIAYGLSGYAILAGLGGAASGWVALTMLRRGRLAAALLGVHLGGACAVAFAYAAVSPLPVISEETSEYYRLGTRVRPWLEPGESIVILAPDEPGGRPRDFSASNLALYLDNRWVAEHRRETVPDRAVILARSPVAERAIRTSILWPRRRRDEPEKWWLLSPVDPDARGADGR